MRTAMTAWLFQGRILPSLPLLDLEVGQIDLTSNLGFDFSVDISVKSSVVLVRVNQYTETDLATLRNAVTRSVQSMVDLGNLANDTMCEVEILSAQSTGGAWTVFDGFMPGLDRSGEFTLSSDHTRLVSSDVQAQAMLSDYTFAMRVPEHTGFYCYRAVEAAMQSFRSPERSADSACWAALRHSLRLDRSALDQIKSHADWARHGKRGYLTWPQRLELLTRTREILSRYIAFASQGRHPLSSEEYPLLS